MDKYPKAPELTPPHEAEDQRSKLRPEHIEWLRQVRSQGATLKWAAGQLGIAVSTAVRAMAPKDEKKEGET